MQAIITKYLPPTNTRGARVSAKCQRGSFTVPWNNSLDADRNHAKAASTLCAHFANEDAKRYGVTHERTNPWLLPRVSGCLPSGEYAHVFLPRT